ncbi:cache domain-containing sensor histidine kinase [Niallia nealsonii]|uniref:HAMP domain-containing protein n=1 Tax=Niallia nealsonii TaxID=115979 RepID=A0A2N0Z6W7_9BACI|nr:sensor histidine kinase [Niallia nealsonii]PKG25266.1 hypothetical protein CWS01_01975 [Niallia nealsonii]
MILNKFYANLSLQRKLLLQFIILSIVPIILIGIVAFFVSYNVTKNNAVQYSKEIVHQSTQKMDELLMGVTKTASMTADEPAIQEALRKPLSNKIADRYAKELDINTRLNFYQSYNDKLFGIYVIGRNGGLYKSNYGTEKEATSDAAWYTKIASSNDITWFQTSKESQIVHTAGEYLIAAGLPIKDKANGNISGVVMVDIPEQELSKIVEAKLGKTGYMFIVDDQDYVVTHFNRNLLAQKAELEPTKKVEKMQEALVKYSKHYIYIEETSSVTGWKIVGMIPLNELTRESIIIRNIIIGIFVIVCTIAIIFSWHFSRRTVQPIKEVSTLMKKVEAGDFSIKMPTKNQDEIGQLSESFNVMIRKLQGLMDSVRKEQESLRQAELKSLQYQINPHFLYNTLDSIVWLVRSKKNDDAIKMVMAITKLFRIGISKGKDIISIKEEIEHVENYLIIQQMRYAKKFDYTIDFPENLYPYQVFKVILQPIVENAIYHGVKLKREKGHIWLSGIETEEYIMLIVKDTGLGMEEDVLQKLNNTLKDAPGEKLNIYGIKNVEERIKLFFGSSYGLTFRSVYGEGTTVEIKIPKVIGVMNNESTVS